MTERLTCRESAEVRVVYIRILATPTDLLVNWSATTLWLLSSFAGTFLRCRWWITSVDDHVGHNNVVPERIPVPSRTTIPQDATKSGSGQRPGSDTDSYASGGAPCPVCL